MQQVGTPVRVFAIGPPGAGKSTLAIRLGAWFRSIGLSPEEITIEQCLRESFRPETANPLSQFYDERGALILLDRPAQVPAALSRWAARTTDAKIVGVGFSRTPAPPRSLFWLEPSASYGSLIEVVRYNRDLSLDSGFGQQGKKTIDLGGVKTGQEPLSQHKIRAIKGN